MNKKDIYLWGTLLALVREQLTAIDKQVQGSLGIWGKARFNSRNKEVQKFLFKLLQRKAQSHGDFAVEALHADIENIEKDNQTWHNITSQEIQYVRNILGGVG